MSVASEMKEVDFVPELRELKRIADALEKIVEMASALDPLRGAWEEAARQTRLAREAERDARTARASEVAIEMRRVGDALATAVREAGGAY